MTPTQAEREDVKAEREAFDQWLQRVDPEKLKWVDESGIRRGERLLYGYAPRGQRAYDTAPSGKGTRVNLLGWLGFDGSGEVAQHLGSVRTWTFRGFILHSLVPQLKPGDIVLWDNASIHKEEGLVAAIEAKGASLRRLPRYSPEKNAIELLWSKLKQLIRRARADALDHLQDVIDAAVAQVTASDARGWIQHCIKTT